MGREIKEFSKCNYLCFKETQAVTICENQMVYVGGAPPWLLEGPFRK